MGSQFIIPLFKILFSKPLFCESINYIQVMFGLSKNADSQLETTMAEFYSQMGSK